MPLKIIHTKNLRWVDIVNPDDSDFNYLKENFRFHPLDFDDVATPAIRAKIDEYSDYHFLVMLFPLISAKDGEIHASEVDFFIGKDFVVTIHDGSMKTLTNLVTVVSQYDNPRVEYMNQGSGFLLYSLLELLFKRSVPILDKINNQVINAGQNIFELEIDTLEKLLKLKKNIIMYRRIMKMHKHILIKLFNSKKNYLQFTDPKPYFQNLIEYAENTWDILASDKESIESFEDTNQSLGTHRINSVLKLLTVVSVIISGLTLVTDVYIFFERAHIQQHLGLDTEFKLLVFMSVTLLFITSTMLYLLKKRKLL